MTDLVLLPGNHFPQPLRPLAAFLLDLASMHHSAQRINLLSTDEDVHPHEIRHLVRRLFVIERGKPGRDRLERGMERRDDGREREGKDQRDSRLEGGRCRVGPGAGREISLRDGDAAVRLGCGLYSVSAILTEQILSTAIHGAEAHDRAHVSVSKEYPLASQPPK